jgi:hypothetical protein
VEEDARVVSGGGWCVSQDRTLLSVGGSTGGGVMVAEVVSDVANCCISAQVSLLGSRSVRGG